MTIHCEISLMSAGQPLHIIYQMERVPLFCRGGVMMPPSITFILFLPDLIKQRRRSLNPAFKHEAGKILSLIISCRPNW